MADFLGQGIHTDVDSATYFADPCPEPSLTQSFAKMLLNQSPAHVRVAHPRLNADWSPEEEKYEKLPAIGNAAHALILGRGKKIEVVRIPERKKQGRNWVVPDPKILADADDMKTDAAKEEYDRIGASGGSPILRKHLDVAEAIRDAARAQLDMVGCEEAFREGAAEVVMIAYDDEYGIWLRSMADWVVSGVLLYDLKTGGQSAAPHEIPKRMVNDGWAIQAAMQERILDIIDPVHRGQRAFRFVAAENFEPYALTVNEISESAGAYDDVSGEVLETALAQGRRQVRRACEIWAECLHRNEWPAYPPVVNRPRYPSYATTQWLNREISEAGQARWPEVNGNRVYREKPLKREALDPNVMLAG